MIPGPRQVGDGTPIPDPRQIGDGDGDVDRGFRALLQNVDVSTHAHGIQVIRGGRGQLLVAGLGFTTKYPGPVDRTLGYKGS